MIMSFVKKQLLLMVRNRQHFTLLLAMPLILVWIINFAVGDLWSQETPALEGKIAIAEHGDEQKDLEQIKQDLNQIPVPEEQKKRILADIEQFQPVHLLKKQVLGNEAFQQSLKLEEITPNQIHELKDNDDYAVIIEVPEHFTYQLFMNIAADHQDTVPELTYYFNESSEFTAGVIMDLLLAFEEEMKTMMIFERYNLADLRVPTEEIKGSVQTLSRANPLTSTMYYAVGMSVMFVLYIASTLGTYAYDEKRLHLFDRLILARSSRWTYLAAIFLTGTLLAFIQLLILYGMSSIFFRMKWPDLNQFLLITFILSMSIGALSTLLTSFNYRMDSNQASSVFSNLIVTVVAFLGGSFFPVQFISEFIKTIGNLTPNGAALSAYLTSLQGYGFSDIQPYLTNLLIFAVTVTIIAAFMFPKRGGAS